MCVYVSASFELGNLLAAISHVHHLQVILTITLCENIALLIPLRFHPLVGC